MMKNIGIVTSGGDAPGMNAAIRAVTRIAVSHGIGVLGFRRGWEGLISDLAVPLSSRSVSGIINLGGTILHTARCPAIKTPEGLAKAAVRLADYNIDGLVVIGGDGSFRAAMALSELTDTPLVGIPATIDNDVYGTDETIGFDTAVNTAVAEIDKIRDTAISLDRIFVVEVMGRKRGFLAATVGLTVGAEIILVPELPFKEADIFKTIKEHAARGKQSAIIVAAEGVGDTRALSTAIETNTGLETRLSILGYAQRGGSPTARSRYLASEFGSKAVELLLDDKAGQVVRIKNSSISSLSLAESTSGQKPLDRDLLSLAERLSQ